MKGRKKMCRFIRNIKMTNVNSVVVSQPDKAVDALMNVIVKGVKKKLHGMPGEWQR